MVCKEKITIRNNSNNIKIRNEKETIKSLSNKSHFLFFYSQAFEMPQTFFW